MPRWSGRSKRRAYVLLASAAVAGLVAARAGASEITSTWSGNSGDWTDATQWSTNPNYPNNGTPSGVNYDALINAPGTAAYTVSLSSSITTDSVTLSSPNATLSQTGGTLTAGALNISAGTYSLSGGAANFSSYDNTGGIFSVSGQNSLEFFPGGAKFNNAGGTIEAGQGSFIGMSPPNVTLTTVQIGNVVTNGGTIRFEDMTIDNTGQTLTFGGSIGSVEISDSTVENGVIDFPSTVFLGHVMLENVTLASDVTATDTLTVQGINAQGHTLNIMGGSGLYVTPAQVGSTSATLSNVNVNLSPFMEISGFAPTLPSTVSLTLDPATNVRGSGGVGFSFSGGTDSSLTNQGTILANVNGQILQVGKNNSYPEPLITNTGTLEAVNGGILDVNPLISLSGFTFAWINNGILSIDAASAINVSQSTYFATGSSLNMMLGSNGSSGLLNITGGLAFQDGAALNLAMEPGAVFSGPYEIATYTSYLAGAFSQVTPGFVVDYSHSGEILVTAIPEPAGAGLVAASAYFALARRRRGLRNHRVGPICVGNEVNSHATKKEF